MTDSAAAMLLDGAGCLVERHLEAGGDVAEQVAAVGDAGHEDPLGRILRHECDDLAARGLRQRDARIAAVESCRRRAPLAVIVSRLPDGTAPA